MTDDGGVSAVGFTTDSFSPMGIRKIVKAATGQPEDREKILLQQEIQLTIKSSSMMRNIQENQFQEMLPSIFSLHMLTLKIINRQKVTIAVIIGNYRI